MRSLYEFGLFGRQVAHGVLPLRIALPFDRQQLAQFLTFMAMIGTLMTTHEVLLVSKPMSMIMLAAGVLLGLGLEQVGFHAGHSATRGGLDARHGGDAS